MRINILKSVGYGSSGLTSEDDALTSPLTLAGDPANPLHAAIKQYVDNGLATKANISYNYTLSSITD